MSAALRLEHSTDSSNILDLMLQNSYSHICQEHGFLYARELESTNKLISNPDLYFQNPASVILHPNIMPSQKDSASLSFEKFFNSSEQKGEVLSQLRACLENRIRSSSLIDEINAVADELVTNAIFNAPFVDPVTHKNLKVDRATKYVEMPPGKAARIFLGFDEARVLIGCQDPFGSLNIENYLRQIQQCYLSGVRQSMNFEEGGAGIGSYIIFNTGSSLYLGVRPEQATIIASVIPYRLSRRQREELPKHLHWIQTDKKDPGGKKWL